MAEIYDFYHVEPAQAEPEAQFSAPQPVIVAGAQTGMASEGFSAQEIAAAAPSAQERLRIERGIAAAGGRSLIGEVLGDQTSFLLLVSAATLLALTLLYAGALVAVRLRRRRRKASASS